MPGCGMDRQFQKLPPRRMAERRKFEEYASIRVKLSAVISREHVLCHIWGLERGDESPLKDLGELDAQGTSQQSFNQQFLTAKLFSFVMFQDKDEPVHDQLQGNFSGTQENLETYL